MVLRFHKHHLKGLKLQNILFVFVLVSFVTPQCFDYLIPHFRIVIYIMRIIAISLFILIYKVSFPNKNDHILYFLSFSIILFGAGQSIAELIKTIDPLAIRFVLFYSGFSLIFIRMLKKNPKVIIKILFYLLGIYNIIQIISVAVFFPNGMTPWLGTGTSKAVYFLGGKNQAFVFMLLFLLVFSIKSISDKGKVPKTIFVIISIFIIEGYILDSMATVVCLELLLLCYTMDVAKAHKLIWRILNPYILLLIISVIFGVFCIANSLTDFSRTSAIAGILYKYNRNLTFTGRTFLWQQAIHMFLKNPILGGDGEFLIVGISLNQAHNAFLDILCKYGLISFVPFLLFLLCFSSAILRIKNNKRVYVIVSISIFTLLFHCCFEYMDMYVMFVFAFLILAITKGMINTNLKVGKTV